MLSYRWFESDNFAPKILRVPEVGEAAEHWHRTPPTFSHYASYSLEYALKRVKQGAWKEIPDPTRPRFFRMKSGSSPFWMLKPDGKVIHYTSRGNGSVMSWGVKELEVPVCEEFVAKDLEEAFDIQFPRTRYFKSKHEGTLYVVSPGKVTTCYFTRNRTQTPSVHLVDLLQPTVDEDYDDAVEFFPKDLAAALDEVFGPKPTPVVAKPVKAERFFHFSKSGPGDALLYILHSDGTTSYIDCDGEEDSARIDEEECNANVQSGYFIEFHPKSKESAIRSRIIAMKYMEGKAAGEKAGYERAKKELLSKLQAA